MNNFITVDREANAIRLRRSMFLGTFLLVEGGTDRTFYERFTDKDACELITTSGKPSSKLRAIKILEILDKDNFKGILAIVDADFDHLENLPIQSPNLIRTDTHDLETILINSPALDKVLSEFGSVEKINTFGRNVRQTLLEVGMSVGYLRWISQLDGLNLTFKSIKFSQFIDQKTLIIDELKLIQEVKNKSQASDPKNEDLQQRLKQQKNDNHDRWQICCGHDLVEILSLGLRKTIGSANASNVELDLLEKSLRLAYEAVYFSQTQIYLSIGNWEANNQPFKVIF